ncbi:AAA family ATPase [Nocardiopsis sp. MG754419]|uniref:AAA family ATPase n=1 Tax=Nocardiopsis sp. MG754419 TaxID=2259865 RepID=UPI001BA95492|nr:AAA family ATPase [Nocardiopsis sp. MG754419]MBR8743329.1 ATP/GTP-binding protein [Nocardiopsis sp. MG754419]
MILLLNGPFGGGKTTTADLLVEHVPNSRLFDPEEIGFMLRHLLPDHPGDFQDLPPWRSLFATVAARVHAFTGQTLIAPMSILRRDYAEEILTGLKGQGLPVVRVLLHPEPDVLAARIDDHDLAPDHPDVNASARAFRRSKMEPYYEAHRAWLQRWSDVVVANSEPSPQEVAAQVLRALPASLFDGVPSDRT